MRRRVTMLATLASVLAVVLFAVPMAVVVARYLITDERNELQRMAATTSATVSGDLSRSQTPATTAPESGTQVTIYDVHGARITGGGPPGPDPVVLRALTGAADTGAVHGRLAAAVPVSDGDTVTGVVLVTSDRSQVNRRILLAWTAMLALATVAVLATALLLACIPGGSPHRSVPSSRQRTGWAPETSPPVQPSPASATSTRWSPR